MASAWLVGAGRRGTLAPADPFFLQQRRARCAAASRRARASLLTVPLGAARCRPSPIPLLQALLHQLGMLPAGYEREPPFELLAPPAAIDPFSILENDEPEAN